MAFLRKNTSENLNIGIIYSIFQKCIRRSLLEESLFYGQLLFKEGSPNCLRKRLIQSCLEDMANLNLALEILNSKDIELEDYIHILCNNKKTHLSAWFQRVSLHYSIYDLISNNTEIEKAKEMNIYEFNNNLKEIRNFLGKDINKLYSFMDKSRLVWAVKILWDNRPELNYTINRNIDNVQAKRFRKIPNWVLDKHVKGGTPGYKFFFENGCKMNNRLYDDLEDYEKECKKLYFLEEKKFGKAKTKYTIERWRQGLYEVGDYIPKVLVGNFYENIIQIQLLTRKGFPRVYFTTKNNKKYVIKGPLSEEDVDKIKFTEDVKKIIKQKHLNVKFKKWNNNYWMISDSLVDYTNDHQVKNSKIESMRPIYSGPNVNCNFEEALKNIPKKLILCAMFKSLVGATDWAARNFLVKGKKIYSIDDHSNLDQEVRLIPKKIKNDSKIKWLNYIKNNNEKLIKKIIKWEKKIKKNKINNKKKLLTKINILKNLIYKI